MGRKKTYRRTLPSGLRFAILQRDGFRCHYCGAPAPAVQLEVDHYIPVASGGTDDPSNLVAACQQCNAGKSAMILYDGTERWSSRPDWSGLMREYSDFVNRTWTEEG